MRLITMSISNVLLTNFCDQALRPAADMLAGLLPYVDQLLAAMQGQGLSPILGTTDAKLFQSTPWADADYAAIAQLTIDNTDSGGRTLLDNWSVIALLRVFVNLQQMKAANPALMPLVAKFAVNPAPIPPLPH